MLAVIRAVYRDNRLELLDPVALDEGQEVQIQIVEKPSNVREALGDLIISEPLAEADDIDEQAIIAQIDNATAGVTLSDAVIDERRTGR